jgi:aryl carrier-like protein
LEIIIDREAGTILGHSARAESDISAELASKIVKDVEALAIALARDDFHELDLIKANSKGQVNGGAVEDDDEGDDEGEEVEPEYLEKVTKLVAKFLKMDSSLLTPTSSLISFGLDSIKSVGLSRVLKRSGVNVPPMEVIRRPTVRSICLFESREIRGALRKEEKEAENLIQYARESLLSHVNQVQILLSDTDKLETYPTTTLQSGMLSQVSSQRKNFFAARVAD